MDRDVARLAFPAGPVDMIDAWFDTIDRAMVEAVPAGALATMKVRERITRLVEARLDALAPDREALRRSPYRIGCGTRDRADIHIRLFQRPGAGTGGSEIQHVVDQQAQPLDRVEDRVEIADRIGLAGIDTRALTRRIRSGGAPNGVAGAGGVLRATARAVQCGDRRR